jgi:diguanylate cyclase (GGDEF)-like protein/PAS domain S-box-containing protein
MKKKVLTNQQLQSVFQQAAVGMVIVDAAQSRFVEVNRRFCEMLGYSAEELMQGSIHDITHPDDLHMDLDHVDRISAGIIRESSWEKRYRKKDGTVVWARAFVTPLDPSEAKPTLRLGVIEDITDRKRAEEALRKREAQLNEMGRIAKVGGWEFDTELQKLVWTKEVYHIHEVDESYEPTVSKGIAFYVPASRPIIERAVQRAIEYGEPFDVELEIVTAKGNHRWVHANGKVDQERGTKKIISGTFQDVTERRQAEEKIRQMAYHDSLTGLPNRMLLIDRMTMAISQADRNRNKVVCMMLDLDKFKEVNDTLGHHIGDLLLKSVAEKLTRMLRQVDTVSRFGGDEFVLVLPEQKDARAALQVARKITRAFRDTVVLDGHSLAVTSSIGISLYPDHGADIDTILKNADSTMYKAKQAGRNRYQFYNKA